MNLKRILILIFSICIVVFTYAQSASELCESGRKAFAVGNFEEAKAYLSKAANMGDSKACGFLAIGYMSGCFETGQDLASAMKWAKSGYSHSMLTPDATCMGVIGWIGTTTAKTKKDWIENLPILEYAYSNGFSASHIGNLISVCYLLKGDKESAKAWAKKIIESEKDEEDKEQYYMASAILAKVLLDSKDYATAMAKSRDAAVFGNPIAQYVMGRCQIKLDIFPEVGQERVKRAALYEYSSLSDINAFENEIQKYYGTIKDKKY